MDGQDFDRLTQQISRTLSRRRVGGMLAALGLVGGLGAVPATRAKRKKKKKKAKACKNGAVKCGAACVDTKTDAQHCGGCGVRCGEGLSCIDGRCQGTGCQGGRIVCGALCVDPNNDEAHCGGCNRPCQGDLTCLNGVCGCAEETKCGNACVDTQTDADHCGSCGNSCGDQECVGGQCNPSGCGQDEIDCGGRCIPAHEHACCSQLDCGGWSTTDLECRNARCVCTRPGEGICQRFTNGAGTCDTCCPGGSGACVRADHVCRASAIHPSCGCPIGYEQCWSTDYGYCSADFDSDPHRCGRDCVDCTQSNPNSACCNGRCTAGTPPGSWPAPGLLCPGNGCQPCPEGTICCTSGPGTPSGCVLGDPFDSQRCPMPPP